MSGKPIVAWAIVVIAASAVIFNLLNLVGLVALIGQAPASQSAGTALASLVIVGLSAWIIYGVLRRTFRSRVAVSLYLWALLVVYPLYNVLRAFGLYLPRPQLADEELAGAALFELLRYLVPLVLIVWVALSKRLKSYFASEADAA